jgi:hypothetical protein
MATKEDLSRLEGRVERIETTMATKEDLSKLGDEMKTMESRIDGKMTAMESRLVEAMKTLFQQRFGE